MARAKKERAKYVAVIESLDQEGRGVARRDGKVVFIEGALPGEKVEYEVYRSKPSFELGLTTEMPSLRRQGRQLRRLRHATSRGPCSGGHEAKGFDGRLVAYRQSPP